MIDVATYGDRIALLGDLSDRDAVARINCDGLALAPGFIDSHSHSDELWLADGGAALSLRSLGGAAARVSPDATAFAHRDAEVMVAAAFLIPRPAPPGMPEEALNRWSPVAALGSGAYVGFLGSAGPADVAAAYPPATYRRLAAVKRRYDPANVFRRTHNILPGRP